MDIKNLVSKLIDRYDTRNPFEIVKGMNVILVYAHLKDIRGFYQYFQRNHIIYIDENLPHREKIFVCAHELGHMLIHKKTNAIYMDSNTYMNTNKYEIEANRFAVELLISNETIEENKNYSTNQLVHLLGYDKNLIELRLESYKNT